mmetsp:Transcript_59607/g.94850  ORF Transcript_59607/g.94850 Transcript_59607/m.94850 type:complete len:338 (-) Transcript_59607:63-1076(-)
MAEGKTEDTNETLTTDQQPRLVAVGGYTFEISIEVLKERKKSSALLIKATETESKDVFAMTKSKQEILSMNWPNKSLESVKQFIFSVLFNPDDGMKHEIGFVSATHDEHAEDEDEDAEQKESDTEDETAQGPEYELADTYKETDVMIMNLAFENKWFSQRWVLKLNPVKQNEIDRLKSIIVDLKKQINLIKKDCVPKGSIVMWSGSVSDVPNGWKLCNGECSTPDLRGRFILASDDNQYQIGDTGGSKSHSHRITVGNTTLTINQIPAHSHTVYVYNRCSTSYAYTGGGSYKSCADTQETTTSSTVGGNQAHNHSGSCTTTSNIPPYIVLGYIMKVV